MKKKNAFTLIELIAVLVILAVIALIVTPLVMNIVKKAKDSANKRSVDAYGKATELAVATYLLDTGDYPTSLDNLKVEYSGNEVVCNVKNLNEDGSIYLSECTVKGTEVKDSKTEDGWYHYGKKVKGFNEYNVGDQITYNGIDFYVIAPSDNNSNYVTLLKAEPLTVDEVNEYGASNINRYFPSYITTGVASNVGGYGGMAYYNSATCGYVDGEIITGCSTNYETSDIKKVVDAWSNDKLVQNDLKIDNLGYKARLITYDDLTNNLGFETTTESTIYSSTNGDTPSWVYNESYGYWTMSAYDDTNTNVRLVDSDYGIGGRLTNLNIDNSSSYYITVRPVINLLKTAISS